jgi:hypothetical protein
MATKDLSNPVDHSDLKTNFVKRTSLKAITTELVLKWGINWKPFKHQLPADVVEWFQKYPAYYEWTDIPAHYLERSRRIQPRFTTLKVYLSNATLVVGKYLKPYSYLLKVFTIW